MFFDGWDDILQIAVVGALAYGGLVVLLRASGKRTLSKMNAFDLVVTVALGSILASVTLSKDVALLDGLVAFATLIGLQYCVAWLSVRSALVRDVVKAEPALLFHDGRMLHGPMRRERVVEAEILAALREQGYADPDEAGAVILETDGSLSVVGRTASLEGGTMGTVSRTAAARPAPQGSAS